VASISSFKIDQIKGNTIFLQFLTNSDKGILIFPNRAGNKNNYSLLLVFVLSVLKGELGDLESSAELNSSRELSSMERSQNTRGVLHGSDLNLTLFAAHKHKAN